MFTTFRQQGDSGRAYGSVAVNPSQVTDVRPNVNGGASINLVGHEYPLNVVEDFSLVTRMLNVALRELYSGE